MSGESDKKIGEVLHRVRNILAFFLFIVLIILVRIIWIQFISIEVAKNTRKMHDRIFRTERIEAHRGTIFTHDYDPLAISIQRYHVEMDFGSEGFDSLRTYRTQSDSLAKLLSAYFGDRTTAQYRELFRSAREKNYQLKYIKDTLVRRSEGWFDHLLNIMRGNPMKIVKLHDTIRNHRPVKIFPRDVDYSEWQVLRKYPILNWNMGMTYTLVGSDERVYTHGELARRTIGKINLDRGDDYGIEAIYNDYLEGEDGSEVRQRIARGFSGRVAGGGHVEAIDGLDVVTTLDSKIQDVAHRSLLDQMIARKAYWGTTVVMDVETGDIVAMVNLNKLSPGVYEERLNNAIGARCNPGSTLKVASTMALLEDAQMPTSTRYDTENGQKVKIGIASVRDAKPGNHVVDLRTAFSKSLNVYFGKAVFERYKDDPQRYVDFFKKLKLDQPVGLTAFGELPPYFPEPGSPGWYKDLSIVEMAYGYGLELTPLQTLTYFNGVANRGTIVAPRLVKEIQKNGRVVKRFPTQVIAENICSDRTIDTLNSLLVEASETGSLAPFLKDIEGFKVASKSGTAQYVQGEYKRGEGYYLGSAIGYMPADKPKYSVITAVMVHIVESGYIYYGSWLGGPVIRDVMQYLYNQEPKWHAQLDTIPSGKYPKNIKGGESKAVEQVVRELMPDSKRVSRGVEWSRVEVDTLSRVSYNPVESKQGVMPDLYNMPLRDAIYILEDLGLKVLFNGSGKVYRQSIKAGLKVREGTTVSLSLR